MSERSSRSYGEQFFEAIVESSESSAEVVSAIAVQGLAPKSVVDFGCGEGYWLRAFERRGISDYQGLDGAHVDGSRLVIPKERFTVIDLEESRPTGRQYDLALCLEVAEHLSETGGMRLVAAICGSASAAVFSAAIPFQGGTGHVNEQWLEYWIERFQKHQWRAIDYFRPHVMFDRRVAWWYRQNLLLFVGPSRDDLLTKMGAEGKSGTPTQEWVHIEAYRQSHRLRSLARELPGALARAISRRLSRGRPSTVVPGEDK